MRSIEAAPSIVEASADNGCKVRRPQNQREHPEVNDEAMFKRRAKASAFKREDSFSESAMSSSFFDEEDTATFDASYFSDGSTTFWTNETDGETNTKGTYWSGGEYTNDTSIRHQTPCFGNGFFQGPCPRASNSRASETQAVSDPGCMHFIWESSSDEDDAPKGIKALQIPSSMMRRQQKSSPSLDEGGESRDETTDLLQDAFSFVSNDRSEAQPAKQAPAQASKAMLPAPSGPENNELDAKLYNLLLGTGSTLLGIDSGSNDSADSRSRGRRRVGRAPGPQPTKSTKVLRKEPSRFVAPWNRQRRRQDATKQEKRDEAPAAAFVKSQRRTAVKSGNPFGGRMTMTKQKSKSKVPTTTERPKSVKPARQTTTDKRLNDAIMVFAAEEVPLPTTLPRNQSAKFIPSKELMRQMERNIDRESFISENDMPTPEALQHLPTLSGRNRPKSRPSSQPIHPLERQASRRSSRSIAKSSNRSTKSKSNRSHVTTKSRQTRSTRTTVRSRKSQAKIPTNQLSFSDDDGNGFFSVGSLDA